MRQLKFRCWNNKEKHWQPFQEWSEAEANAYGLMSGIYELENDEFFTWSQFTGRRDDYGNEVFEGDILKTRPLSGRSKKSVATYHDNSARYCGIPFTPLFEVIGNIYENPELLEAKS